MRSKLIDVNWPLVSVAVLGALVTACGSPQSEAPAPEQPQTAPTGVCTGAGCAGGSRAGSIADAGRNGSAPVAGSRAGRWPA